MKRTVSIPVSLPAERFLPLMKRCAEIFNAHTVWMIQNRTYSKARAHKAIYEGLRQKYPELPSAFVQSMRDTASEACKAVGMATTPRKKPMSGIRYDKRTLTLRGEQLTLSCIGKRVKVILSVPEHFKAVFYGEEWKLKGATLTYERKRKRFWIRLVYQTKTPPKQKGLTLGIDRGIYHLAVTSDGEFHSGNILRASQRRYLFNRRTLQAKGTPSARRRMKAMGGKEQRFSRDVNHCLAKEIANKEDVAIFVLEDLTGIRSKNCGKKLNKWLSSWPFYQLELLLTYKAEALGKKVVHVDARYTSQKCNRCGHTDKANRVKSKFHCKRCGFKAHADYNAALNIRDNYLLSLAKLEREATSEQGSVNAPYATTAEVSSSDGATDSRGSQAPGLVPGVS